MKLTEGKRRVTSEVSLASLVKAGRKQQGLTQRALAERAYVSRSTVQKIESGSHEVRILGVIRILQVLGITLNLIRQEDMCQTAKEPVMLLK